MESSLFVQVLADGGDGIALDSFIRSENERPQKTHKEFPKACIPVVDFEELRGKNSSRALANMQNACQEWGFFYLVNHGLAQTFSDRLMGMCREFFALSVKERELCAPTQSELSSEGYGTKMGKPGTVWDWGDHVYLNGFPKERRNCSLWDRLPVRLRECVEEYLSHNRELYQKLIGILSEGLGLIPSLLSDTAGFEQQFLINYYPQCPQPELVLGAHKHSDFGLLTFLMEDDVGGLQVLKDNIWYSVQPVAGAYVVNVGDQLELLSNGRYRSGDHRVLVNREEARMSIATFNNPSKNAVIRPPPQLIDDQHPRLYQDIVAGDYESGAMHNYGVATKYLQVLSLDDSRLISTSS